MNRNRHHLCCGMVVAALCAAGVAWAEARPTPGSGLLAPDNHVLILIDHHTRAGITVSRRRTRIS